MPVDRRRRLDPRLRESGQAGKRDQATGAEAPVDELVTGIDPAALLNLDRPLADATVAGDPVGLHEQAAAGRARRARIRPSGFSTRCRIPKQKITSKHSPVS